MPDSGEGASFAGGFLSSYAKGLQRQNEQRDQDARDRINNELNLWGKVMDMPGVGDDPAAITTILNRAYELTSGDAWQKKSKKPGPWEEHHKALAHLIAPLHSMGGFLIGQSPWELKPGPQMGQPYAKETPPTTGMQTGTPQQGPDQMPSAGSVLPVAPPVGRLDILSSNPQPQLDVNQIQSQLGGTSGQSLTGGVADQAQAQGQTQAQGQAQGQVQGQLDPTLAALGPEQLPGAKGYGGFGILRNLRSTSEQADIDTQQKAAAALGQHRSQYRAQNEADQAQMQYKLGQLKKYAHIFGGEDSQEYKDQVAMVISEHALPHTPASLIKGTPFEWQSKDEPANVWHRGEQVYDPSVGHLVYKDQETQQVLDTDQVNFRNPNQIDRGSYAFKFLQSVVKGLHPDWSEKQVDSAAGALGADEYMNRIWNSSLSIAEKQQMMAARAQAYFVSSGPGGYKPPDIFTMPPPQVPGQTPQLGPMPTQQPRPYRVPTRGSAPTAPTTPTTQAAGPQPTPQSAPQPTAAPARPRATAAAPVAGPAAAPAARVDSTQPIGLRVLQARQGQGQGQPAVDSALASPQNPLPGPGGYMYPYDWNDGRVIQAGNYLMSANQQMPAGLMAGPAVKGIQILTNATNKSETALKAEGKARQSVMAALPMLESRKQALGAVAGALDKLGGAWREARADLKDQGASSPRWQEIKSYFSLHYTGDPKYKLLQGYALEFMRAYGQLISGGAQSKGHTPVAAEELVNRVADQASTVDQIDALLQSTSVGAQIDIDAIVNVQNAALMGVGAPWGQFDESKTVPVIAKIKDPLPDTTVEFKNHLPLPTKRGQQISDGVAIKYYNAFGRDKQRANAAAMAAGWSTGAR